MTAAAERIVDALFAKADGAYHDIKGNYVMFIKTYDEYDRRGPGPTNLGLMSRDELVALIDREVGGWQPIETAPKTGERILLGHGNSVWEDEWWANSRWPEGGVWLECTPPSGEHLHEVPTHWMPLPEPPKEEP